MINHWSRNTIRKENCSETTDNPERDNRQSGARQPTIRRLPTNDVTDARTGTRATSTLSTSSLSLESSSARLRRLRPLVTWHSCGPTPPCPDCSTARERVDGAKIGCEGAVTTKRTLPTIRERRRHRSAADSRPRRRSLRREPIVSDLHGTQIDENNNNNNNNKNCNEARAYQ